MQRAEAHWHRVHFGDSREQRSYVGGKDMAVSLLLQRRMRFLAKASEWNSASSDQKIHILLHMLTFC